ncbi:MAG: DUF2460 domain-containing protein [Maricaulis sp.]|jgi:uncharacterized protein (TIGR02217 family)|nr:DUF2460 domain-containing protein [Maricaulis sp.]
MSGFHEVSFPFSVGLGAVGGPRRLTEIVPLVSGAEERNSPWADSRRHWDAGPGVRSADDLQDLLAFFEARRGQLHGFRFCDPLDHQSCAPSAVPSATDQLIGTGDGAMTEFALRKIYASGAQSWSRRIVKPVAGSVIVAVDGAVSAASVDTATGLVTLAEAPVAGAVVSAGFVFDCPVRFDTDRLEISMDFIAAGAAPSVPLIELKL